MKITAGLLTLLASSTSVVAWPQFPLPAAPVSKVTPNDPFHTFVNHFSSDRVGTDVLLQTRFNDIFANDTVTVTQDYQFNLFRYAAEQPHKVLVHPLDDVESLRQIRFFPSIRKRDGEGVLAESITFAGYQVAYEDTELKVFVAQWVDGFSETVQWHLVGDPQVAKRLLRETMAWCTTIRDAILIFDQGYWHPDHALWEAVQKANWDDVILDKDFKDRLTADYRSFFKSEQTYKDLQVPWKRGLVFLGPPGNGKTISLKAIMKEVKYPALYVKSFHSWGGDQMGIREVFQRARAEAPCVLVMEDLDSLINDDNRSFFLNEVDGLEDNDGLLMIGTTNHFDRLDPALSSRPSRFDRKYTFADPKRPERRAYAVYWQSKLKSNKNVEFPDEMVDQVADRTSKFSFAYLKEAFVSTLLTLAGRDGDPKDKGHDFAKVLLDEIKRLREQLEDEEDQVGTFSKKVRKGFRPQPRPAKGDEKGRPASDPADSMSSSVQRSTSLTAQYLRDGVPGLDPVRAQMMMEKMDVEYFSKHHPRGADSSCFRLIMKIGPDGKAEFISHDQVPDHIMVQMDADERSPKTLA